MRTEGKRPDSTSPAMPAKQSAASCNRPFVSGFFAAAEPVAFEKFPRSGCSITQVDRNALEQLGIYHSTVDANATMGASLVCRRMVCKAAATLTPIPSQNSSSPGILLRPRLTRHDLDRAKCEVGEEWVEPPTHRTVAPSQDTRLPRHAHD